jgi:hypothetical protein
VIIEGVLKINSKKKSIQSKLFKPKKKEIQKQKNEKITNFEKKSTPDKNVFQIWLANNKNLPFKVRRWSWHPSTYFLVKKIVDIKWDYFKKTGSIYGKAFGDMYLRGRLTEKNIKLGCSGCYQWELVT